MKQLYLQQTIFYLFHVAISTLALRNHAISLFGRLGTHATQLTVSGEQTIYLIKCQCHKFTKFEFLLLTINHSSDLYSLSTLTKLTDTTISLLWFFARQKKSTETCQSLQQTLHIIFWLIHLGFISRNTHPQLTILAGSFPDKALVILSSGANAQEHSQFKNQ